MSGNITAYYDFAKLFSYNATFNAVLGGRGLGKTWGSKEKGIKDALKCVRVETRTVEGEGRKKSKTVYEINGPIDQFIYLRRYKEELALARATFFADIEWRFPDWDFRLLGWEAQASPREYAHMERGRPWATIGYFVALSVAQNYKSVQFPDVKTIIFDEFVAEKGVQYLPSESSKLVNFYNTVDRSKDKTRVIMLANSVSINNPYFIQYKVDPRKVDKNGFIRQAKMATGEYYMIWHFPEASEYANEVKATKYGQFIHATDPEYFEYAVTNKFADGTNKLVATKPSSARYLLTLETGTGIFSVWYDMKSSMYFCQKKRPNADEDIVTMDPRKMSEGKRIGLFTDKTMGRLRSAYRHDKMRFDEPATTNAFVEVFKR